MTEINQNLPYRRKADEMLEKRLAAIEEELKLLRQLVERVVRLDERLASNIEKYNSIDDRQDKHEAKLDGLEVRVRALETTGAKNSQAIGGIERFFWIAVTVAVAWIGDVFKRGH